MTKEEILKFIRANPVAAVATIEGEIPRVRMIMTYRADENGIIFCTGEDKDLHKQLSSRPDIEMCYYSAEQNKQVRVSGAVEVIEDLELKQAIVRDFSFLKEWIDRKGYEALIVYCLRNGKAVVWTMETNFAPKEPIQL